MLIATLALGGAILGATSIAGLLMLYQIRATTDSQSSAKSIFAADAGVDWSLYSIFHPPQTALPGFANGAAVIVTCYDASGAALAKCDGTAGTPDTAITQGTDQKTKRAFFVNLSAATSTLP